MGSANKSVRVVSITKKDLKLNKQIYHCNNYQEKIDRDFNASLNIAKTDKYALA